MLENVQPLYGQLNRDIEYLLPKSQEKTVTPSQEQQIVLPDEDYTSLSKVTVEKIPDSYVDINSVVINDASYLFYYGARTENLEDLVKLISSNCELYNSMFNTNKKISTLSLFNTSNGKDFTSMFSNSSIIEIPNIDTSNGEKFTRFAENCTNLKNFPLLNTGKGTSFENMFYGCTGITEIPNIDTSNGTNFNSMFQRSGLVKAPQLNTSNGANFQSFLRQIPLVEAPLYDFSSANMISYIFYGTTTVTTLGGFKDLGKGYNFNQQNYSSYKLDLSTLTLLTHQSLMNVINNLYDIATAGIKPQDLVIATECQSLLSDSDIAIATNKGWNVSFA